MLFLWIRLLLLRWKCDGIYLKTLYIWLVLLWYVESWLLYLWGQHFDKLANTTKVQAVVFVKHLQLISQWWFYWLLLNTYLLTILSSLLSLSINSTAPLFLFFLHSIYLFLQWIDLILELLILNISSFLHFLSSLVLFL